jgi:tetratricopeptide (TPR) repeat protein
MKNVPALIVTLFTCFCASAQITDSAQFYFKKGVIEKSARRYLVAAKYFDKATGFDPKFTEAFIENGKANLAMRKIDAALDNFTKANLLEPANRDAIKELSTLYFNNRQFQKAIEMAQKCKDCPGADKITGMSYYYLEDYGKAVVQLQKALSNSSSEAEVCYALGRSYMELEQENNAILYYKKAIDLDTSKNMWMYELGLLYYSGNHYTDALQYFLRAANAGYPKSNDYYENLGFAYLYSNDIENGIKILSSLLSRKPGSITLISDIAEALYKVKRYDDALIYYQKLMDLNQKDAKALYMAGIIFIRKGQKERGQALCDKAIAMDPSLAEKKQKTGGEQFGL